MISEDLRTLVLTISDKELEFKDFDSVLYNDLPQSKDFSDEIFKQIQKHDLCIYVDKNRKSHIIKIKY